MEVDSVDEIISTPLSHISSLCNQDAIALHNLNNVSKYFRSKVDGKLSEIPCINDVSLENIPSNSLVRFRGMIQDMFDPEFYLGRYSVTNRTTKETIIRYGCYTDIGEKPDEEIDFDSSSNKTLERQTYFCVPVPGENQWLKETFVKNSSYVPVNSAFLSKNKKRVYAVNGNEDNGMCIDDSTAPVKRLKSENGVEDGDTQISKGDSNKWRKSIPLPEENGISCFLSMYSDYSDLKLNDVIEFVGILSTECHYITAGMDDDGDDEMPSCTNVSSPQQRKIPSVHCLYFNKLSMLNPAINMKNELYEITSKELSTIRNDLLQLLSNVFYGDTTVAEYFLIHLVSSTYAVVGTLCVGKFSLNVTSCLEKFPRALYTLIQKIVEKSYFLPLTVENLNKMSFSPKKDYEANKLLSGVLQLSNGTNLVLDETAMQPGTLDSGGLNNLKAVGNLIQWQNVDYDFKFSKVDMKTDVNVMILSEGKSMLKCDCQISLIPSEKINIEHVRSTIESINPMLLEKIRIYLSIIRSIEFNLTEEVSKALEEDFVEMRKLDSKAVTAESFSLLLTTARYMALSYGQNTLDAPLWTRAKDLDAERRKRST